MYVNHWLLTVYRVGNQPLPSSSITWGEDGGQEANKGMIRAIKKDLRLILSILSGVKISEE